MNEDYYSNPHEVPAKTPLQEPARGDARPPNVLKTPDFLMEGERPREPIRGFASASHKCAMAEDLIGMFKADSRILATYLHGSCVAGTERADSDLDCGLLLYPGFRISTLERMQMNGSASAQLHRQVDIGILSPVSLVYFIRAVAGGYCLYCANSGIRDLIVAHAFADYAQLREDRRPVEDAYRAA